MNFLVTVISVISSVMCIEVNLTATGLTEFPTNLPANVQTLILKSNQLTEMTEENLMMNLTELKTLYLDRNTLQDISDVAVNGSKISLLSASVNRLTSIPILPSLSSTLRHLTLNTNYIVNVSMDVFLVYPRLYLLWLANNLIKQVDCTPLPYYFKHDMLNFIINKNVIDYVDPKCFVHMPKLEVLQMYELGISMNWDEIIPWIPPSVKDLYLARNPSIGDNVTMLFTGWLCLFEVQPKYTEPTYTSTAPTYTSTEPTYTSTENKSAVNVLLNLSS